MSEDYINGQIQLPGPISGIGGPRGGRLDLNPLVLAATTYATHTAALKIVALGTMPGIGGASPVQTGGLVGLQVETTPQGDISHCNGQRVAGLYSVVHLNAAALAGVYEVVTGVAAAGEFELDVTTEGDAFEMACICARANRTNAGNAYHAASSFIRIREAGTKLMPNLFHIVRASAAHDSGEMVCETSTIPAVNDDGWVQIKVMVGGTTYWLVATDTAPAA
jgi:hypothetical protein